MSWSESWDSSRPPQPSHKHVRAYVHTHTQLGLVTFFYIASYKTVKNLVHRHLKMAQPHPGLAMVAAQIRSRLFKYTLTFCVSTIPFCLLPPLSS